MKKVLFILNDAPYGNEKAYNALRMAMNLQKENSPIDIRAVSYTHLTLPTICSG